MSETLEAELAAVSLALAERLRYRCADPQCAVLRHDTNLCNHGWVYPLRVPCRCCQDEDDPCWCGPHCGPCSGRGWVPAELHLESLLAAAAKCGITLLLPWPFGDRDAGLGYRAEALRGLGEDVSFAYDPTDRVSILLAAGKALVEVLG